MAINGYRNNTSAHSTSTRTISKLRLTIIALNVLNELNELSREGPY